MSLTGQVPGIISTHLLSQKCYWLLQSANAFLVQSANAFLVQGDNAPITYDVPSLAAGQSHQFKHKFIKTVPGQYNAIMIADS